MAQRTGPILAESSRVGGWSIPISNNSPIMIIQEIVQVGEFLIARHPDRKVTWLSLPVLAGLIVGLVVMYGTAAAFKL